MAAFFIVFSKYIENERLHIIIQRFMVQEQFCQKAEVLTVNLAKIAVHFENREIATAIDFSGRRMRPGAFFLFDNLRDK